MKSTLLMRIQGMEQEVCQLFFATLCRKIDGKWQCVAVLAEKWQKKATGIDANGFLRGLVA
jgi:hypothetical protein